LGNSLYSQSEKFFLSDRFIDFSGTTPILGGLNQNISTNRSSTNGVYDLNNESIFTIVDGTVFSKD